MMRRLAITARSVRNVRCMSDSVTYSGGHASQGQGGFYGSGGSRAKNTSHPTHRPEAIARVADIKELTQIMEAAEAMETELRTLTNVVNSRTIELKARLKKTVSNPKVLELLNRLEIKGEPVWGLSSKERDLVRLARQKYNSS